MKKKILIFSMIILMLFSLFIFSSCVSKPEKSNWYIAELTEDVNFIGGTKNITLGNSAHVTSPYDFLSYEKAR